MRNNDFRGEESITRVARYCAVMAIYERLPRRQKEHVLVNSEQNNPADNASHRCATLLVTLMIQAIYDTKFTISSLDARLRRKMFLFFKVHRYAYTFDTLRRYTYTAASRECVIN